MPTSDAEDAETRAEPRTPSSDAFYATVRSRGEVFEPSDSRSTIRSTGLVDALRCCCSPGTTSLWDLLIELAQKQRKIAAVLRVAWVASAVVDTPPLPRLPNAVPSKGLRPVGARPAHVFGVDHLISHVLAVLPVIDVGWWFYGGTALNRSYVSGRRLSEDVDLMVERVRFDIERPLSRPLSRGCWRNQLDAARSTICSKRSGKRKPWHPVGRRWAQSVPGVAGLGEPTDLV